MNALSFSTERLERYPLDGDVFAADQEIRDVRPFQELFQQRGLARAPRSIDDDHFAGRGKTPKVFELFLFDVHACPS